MLSKHKQTKDLLVDYAQRTDLLDSSAQEKIDWFRFYFEKVYKTYFEPLSKKASILDLGCNRGYLLKVLSEQGFDQLYGVDLSRGDISKARTIIPEANLKEQDIFDYLKETKETFNVIILKALIEHIEKKRILELLELIEDRLSADGFLLIDVYNAAYLFAPYERYMDFTHEVGFTKESLTQVLTPLFRDIAVTPIASPIKFFGRREKLEYHWLRKLVKYIIGCIEPEMRQLPILERSLIAVGYKK